MKWSSMFSALDENIPDTITWSRSTDFDCLGRVVICPLDTPDKPGLLIRTNDPKLLMASLMEMDAGIRFRKPRERGRGCVIADDVIIGKNTIIGDNVIIKNASIGENCTIHSGVIIGEDGFGFAGGKRFPHIGKVLIGDNVEINDNCCIARGCLKDTILEDGVKIDNLCHVAHNCHLKKDVILTAGVTMGGSVTIGERVWVGVGATITDGIEIGDDVIVGVGAVIIHDIPDRDVVVGNPARAIPRKSRYTFQG